MWNFVVELVSFYFLYIFGKLFLKLFRILYHYHQSCMLVNNVDVDLPYRGIGKKKSCSSRQYFHNVLLLKVHTGEESEHLLSWVYFVLVLVRISQKLIQIICYYLSVRKCSDSLSLFPFQVVYHFLCIPYIFKTFISIIEYIKNPRSNSWIQGN